MLDPHPVATERRPIHKIEGRVAPSAVGSQDDPGYIAFRNLYKKSLKILHYSAFWLRKCGHQRLQT